MNQIIDSFYRTVIEEQRYKLILTGLKSTLIISLVSIVVGTIFGILLCYLRKSNCKIISNLSKFFINLIQGIPITLLLLTFYYVIFAYVNIDPIVVAIISFSLYFGAYISEVFRGAINSINKNQVQASYSIGFNKFQTIKYVLLPQMLTYIIPTFKNESVSLIKLTSIAGYISIMDLTKASDIIRNRTYEAFFPLIITTFIYFIICSLFGILLNYIYIKINPRYKKNGGN